jgi:hypothetical protein
MITTISRNPNRIVIAALLAAVLLLSPSVAVRAATTAVANTNDAGAGSLRAAIAAAGTGDTLDLTGLSGTITLTSGELLITKDLTLTGPGAGSLTISGGGASRVFSIDSGNTVSVSGVTVTGGNGVGASNTGNGGAFRSAGTLTLNAVTLTGNVSSGAAGVYSFLGTLNVTNSTISNNTTTFDGTGIHAVGGTTTITSSTLSGNDGRNGGALKSDNNGNVTITDSTLSGNTGETGAGISNDSTLTIIRSTISGNVATQSGGGIFTNFGTLTITNSTLSGNTTPAWGGAIYNSQATINFTNSTIANNTASTAGGGLRTDGSGTATFVNTIIANNTGGDCFGAGTYTSNDYNLDSDNSCNLTGSNDLTSTDPLLGALANNGGSTLTHLPGTGSPAIGAASNSAAPATDQIGTSRPQGSTSDIGAIEAIVAVASVPGVTTWGLLTLTVLLAVVVLYSRRRAFAR